MYEVHLVKRSSNSVCIPVALSFDPSLVRLVAKRILQRREQALVGDEVLSGVIGEEKEELRDILCERPTIDERPVAAALLVCYHELLEGATV